MSQRGDTTNDKRSALQAIARAHLLSVRLMVPSLMGRKIIAAPAVARGTFVVWDRSNLHSTASARYSGMILWQLMPAIRQIVLVPKSF